jgi:hypothetical protein
VKSQMVACSILLVNSVTRRVGSQLLIVFGG